MTTSLTDKISSAAHPAATEKPGAAPRPSSLIDSTEIDRQVLRMLERGRRRIAELDSQAAHRRS